MKAEGWRPQKGDRNGPFLVVAMLLYSVLPAVDASPDAAAVELDKTLLPHRERRVEEGPLIKLRKGFLRQRHRDHALRRSHIHECLVICPGKLGGDSSGRPSANPTHRLQEPA